MRRKSLPENIYYLLLVLSCYMGLFLLCAPILSSGRGLVWRIDGLPQHLNGLIAVGIALRAMIRGFLSGKGLAIEEFVFSAGYGSDATALIPYWDPLNWLSALVPTAYTEYLFYFLISVRVVLCATTFSLYARYKGNALAASFISSLTYAFSGFAVCWGILRHPFMLNAAYVFPLVLLGLEKVFNDEKPTFFVLTLALSFVLSAYFTYMIAIFTIGYFIARYLAQEGKRSVKEFLILGLRFLGYGVVAFLVSAAASLPYIMSVISLDRIGVGTYVPPLHQFTYYLSSFSDLVGAAPDYNGEKRYIGPIVFVLCVVFFSVRNRFIPRVWTSWGIGLVTLFACSLIPFAGHVFNGFGYVSDRWLFALNFCAAYVACLSLPILRMLTPGEWRRVGLVIFVAACLSLLPLLYTTQALAVILGVFVLVGVSLLLFVAATKLSADAYSVTLVMSSLGCAGLLGFVLCAHSPVGLNYQSDFIDPIGSAYSFYTEKNPYESFDTLPTAEKQSWRYSIPNTAPGYRLNESLNQKRNGLSAYVSLYNQPIDTLRKELGISDYAFSNCYAGSNSRFAIDCLSGAKYFFANETEEWRVPATYEPTDTFSNGYRLYKTEHAVPLAFSTNDVIPKDAYTDLTMVGKQEALLQGVVLDKNDMQGGASRINRPIDISSSIPSLTIECDGGISVESDGLHVSKAGASCRLVFDGVSDSEYYLCFENLTYEEPEVLPQNNDRTLREAILSLNESRPEDFEVKLETSLGSRSFMPSTPYSFKYCGKENWAYNAGYSSAPITSMEVSFNRAGMYTYDSMYVAIQPIAPLIDKADSLRSGGMDEVRRGVNSVTANSFFETGSSYVVFTLPYSTGWEAKVDGEFAKVLKADTGFLAVYIEDAGEHKIELVYSTPGFRMGLLLSLMGIGITCALAFKSSFSRLFRRNDKPSATIALTRKGRD